jgi:hypothetical protein
VEDADRREHEHHEEIDLPGVLDVRQRGIQPNSGVRIGLCSTQLKIT